MSRTRSGRAGAAARAARAASRATPAELPRLGYRPALDGLRCFAVVAVMCWHFVVPGVKGGFLGVDLFFVLSGFLITTLLVEEWADTGGVSLRRFYARRALRLFPALALVLLLTAPFVERLHTLLAAFYVANWGVATGHFPVGPIRHLWSLSVEEQFYIVWPMLLLGMLRARLPRALIVGITLALAAASTVFKIVTWRSPADWTRLYSGTDGRADQLLVGCALALILAWYAWPRRASVRALVAVAVAPALGLLAFLIVNAAVYWEFFYHQAGFALVALATATLIAAVMLSPDGWLARALAWRPFALIGRISYGLYLWHQPIGWFTDPRHYEWVPFIPRWWQLALRFVLSFAVAGLSWWLLERPVLRFKDRFEPAERREETRR